MLDVNVGQETPNVLAAEDVADDLLTLNVKSLNLASNATSEEVEAELPTAETEAVASVISVVALTWAT